VGLKLTVLGCCGSYPGSGGACSGYLVRGAGTTLWLEAGSGTLANLQRHVGLHDVDAIVLSHEHPDHWSDIEGYHVACTSVLPRRGVPVYAPAGLRDITHDDTEPTFAWHTVTDRDSVDVGGMRLTFSRTDHGPETLAVRIDADGRSLGYSADTGPRWSLAALGSGLDLVLCEATFLRRDEGHLQHLSARQAGTSAREARAKQLVLTHIWPTVDPAQIQAEGAEAFGAPVELAATDKEYSV
jgi:ribonuclease BN (tRNA processing enzyme)